MQTYRLAQKDELQEVATLFTESFLDYPLFTLILTPGQDYKNHLFLLNYTNTKSYFQQNGCFVCIQDGKIVSAVLLKKSGEKSPGLFRYLFNGGLDVGATMGIKRLTYVLKTLDNMKEACNRYGKDTWYIDSLAVAKGFQGQSLGSSMFNTFIFPHVSKHGGGRVLLVTHTELNKKFYGKNGFEVFSEYPIGSDGNTITNFCFQKEITCIG